MQVPAEVLRPMTNTSEKNPKDIEALIKTMRASDEVTAQLQQSYDDLQTRIKKLDYYRWI